jgi:hypothetical protein
MPRPQECARNKLQEPRGQAPAQGVFSFWQPQQPPVSLLPPPLVACLQKRLTSLVKHRVSSSAGTWGRHTFLQFPTGASHQPAQVRRGRDISWHVKERREGRRRRSSWSAECCSAMAAPRGAGAGAEVVGAALDRQCRKAFRRENRRGKSQGLDFHGAAAAASLNLVDVAFVGWTPSGRAGVGALCPLVMLGTWAIFQRAEISDKRCWRDTRVVGGCAGTHSENCALYPH